jgi:hypothetical protein
VRRDICFEFLSASSIGSQWRTRIQQAGIDVAAALPAPPRPIFTMNLNMTV